MTATDHPLWSPELERADAILTATCDPRVALVSPPRTGSTAVARLLWQHSAIRYHCHEPFEAMYWGARPAGSAAAVLRHPLDMTTGERVTIDAGSPPGGLLVKEMTFQLDAARFAFLARLCTAPVVFVIRDPRLSTTSRLRIVRELNHATTFPPAESGWPALAAQVRTCREQGIRHVIVDTDDVRADPAGMTAALVAACGLPPEPGLHTWAPRPDLRLCAPEVGALMGAARTADDPFYRRVLASSGVQPPERTDWGATEAAIRAAGLSADVMRWSEIYHDDLRTDAALLATPTEPAP